MGNRAVITTEGYDRNTTSIYVHWNGGRDSVEGYLAYAKMKGFRNPVKDSYGMARLAQVISNFFTTDGSCDSSIGVGPFETLDYDNYDNGVYVINGDWEIVGREYFDGEEQDRYPLADMMVAIDEHMPKAMQVGVEGIMSWLAENGA